MGLFDDIPMVRGAGSRPGARDPAAGRMRFERAPPPEEDDSPEEDDLPESSDPVQFAQARALPLPLPGIPGGLGVAPDIWDAWRKGALEGIKGARNFYRQSVGPVGGGDDEDCKKERKEAREICIEAMGNDWKSDFDVGPYRKPGGGRWTLEDCVRGLVSERCGGNRLEEGWRTRGKPRRR